MIDGHHAGLYGLNMTEKYTGSGGSREGLLDAAEALMREQGYGAVTSRKVAARAGLKPQLVHYYFRTMDDLFLDLFRRVANDIIGLHEAAEQSSQPLRDLWNIIAGSRYRLLICEFVALANHRERVRAEFIHFGNQVRQTQIRLMRQVLDRHGVHDFPWTPAFASILLHSLARFLALETELGVSEGHADAVRAVNFYIDRLDKPMPLEARLSLLEAENAALRRRLATDAERRCSDDGAPHDIP
jgi:AcrR family transcriptional regulator